MKILFIDTTHPSLHEELVKAGFQCHLNFNLTTEQIIQDIDQYEGVIIRSKIKFTREIIDRALRLKFIARVGAGMENIDVSYAESKGISCLHAPEGNRDAVAEHALGMLLSLLNNIGRADKEVRAGKWIREGNRGVELAGKTIGVIGFGNMGSAFAQRLKCFGCEVIAYDKYKKGFGSEHVKEVGLTDIFKRTDVLSLHLPLTDETNYLINDTFINKFAKPFYIINTARGKILNTADLVKNMRSGKVLGTCLDVLEYETISFEDIDTKVLPEPFQYLIRSDKVILTPHIAGWTHESNEKMARVLVNKIKMLYNL
ncbi:MAG: 2-hydroxyacid dehydrogenase [Bacteroidia bacterium]|nr:2-hydroxyacid dehydrogenase [Bacteroidia bacterium]